MHLIRSLLRSLVPAVGMFLLGATPGRAADSPESIDIPHYTFTRRNLHTFPHDANAFTQGLIYLNGMLYETTGLNGRSSLRKVALESGHGCSQKGAGPVP